MTEDDPHDRERSKRDARARGSEPDSGPPPHPMDRIWAHPSELGSGVGDPAKPIPSRGPSWGVAVIAATCGVAATLAIVMLAGGFDQSSGARTASDLVPAFPELGVDRTAGIVATVSSSIVAIRVVHSSSPAATPDTGTGVVLGDARILTNASLVEVGDTITVTTADGTVLGARLLGRDRATDLASSMCPRPTPRVCDSDPPTGSPSEPGCSPWARARGSVGGRAKAS